MCKMLHLLCPFSKNSTCLLRAVLTLFLFLLTFECIISCPQVEQTQQQFTEIISTLWVCKAFMKPDKVIEDLIYLQDAASIVS